MSLQTIVAIDTLSISSQTDSMRLSYPPSNSCLEVEIVDLPSIGAEIRGAEWRNYLAIDCDFAWK